MNKIFLILLIAVIAVQVNARPGDDDKTKDPAKDAKDAAKDGKDAADKAKKDGADAADKAKKDGADAAKKGGKINIIEDVVKVEQAVVGTVEDGIHSFMDCFGF